MSQSRKTLTQYADELDQWVAQGWLTGHETFIDLQDMITLTDLIYQEAAGSQEVQAEILGIKGRFETVLASYLPPGSPGTILEALHTHPRRPSWHVAWHGAVLAQAPGGFLMSWTSGRHARLASASMAPTGVAHRSSSLANLEPYPRRA